jgi:hypothetical protein
VEAYVDDMVAVGEDEDDLLTMETVYWQFVDRLMGS